MAITKLSRVKLVQLKNTVRTTCPACATMSHHDFCRLCGAYFWRCGCRDPHDHHTTYTPELLGLTVRSLGVAGLAAPSNGATAGWPWK